MASNGARSLRRMGGAAGGWLALATSSGAARRASPPAEGGIQILGRAEARQGSGFGVPVIMQLKLQQSFVVSVDVPQIPFIDRVLDISAASQRQVRTVQIVQKTGYSSGAVLG